MTEAYEAKRDGAQLQPNSGRGTWRKGDATTGFFLIDYKEASKSFNLNPKVWAKVCTDAAKVNIDLSPALKVIFGAGNQKLRLGIVPWDVLELLVDAYEELEGIKNG
jgi:hypothetical protein